jgi:hypothetical protein
LLQDVKDFVVGDKSEKRRQGGGSDDFCDSESSHISEESVFLDA